MPKRRRASRSIVGVLTGHNSLAAHMFRIEILQYDTCPSCNEEVKSNEHLVFECPSYERFKQQIFGAIHKPIWVAPMEGNKVRCITRVCIFRGYASPPPHIPPGTAKNASISQKESTHQNAPQSKHDWGSSNGRSSCFHEVFHCWTSSIRGV